MQNDGRDDFFFGFFGEYNAFFFFFDPFYLFFEFSLVPTFMQILVVRWSWWDMNRIYGRAEGLPSDEPIVVRQDERGEIWVGYHDSGLLAFRPGKPRVPVVTRRRGRALHVDDVLPPRPPIQA